MKKQEKLQVFIKCNLDKMKKCENNLRDCEKMRNFANVQRNEGLE